MLMLFLLAVFCLYGLIQPESLFAYVDPGSGFVFMQSTASFWAFLLIFLLLPFKFIYRFLKRHFRVALVILICIIIGGIILKSMISRVAGRKKVIVLGFDAMDYSITKKLMEEGRLPNFSYLKSQGSFSSLATTNPSESVVAWTSFSTGVNPAKHGIFDFIMRKPSNYLPYLTFSETPAVLGKSPIKSRKRAPGFWEILSRHGIPSYLYFCPNTFPPEKLRGEMISGMGTPDLLGMIGKFSFYTSRPAKKEDAESRGRINRVSVIGNSFTSYLYGPKVNKGGLIVEAKVPLSVELKPGGKSISISFQNNTLELGKNQWSDWCRVSFNLGFLKKVHGIVRFYLNSVSPDFELYVSPINIDPVNPVFAISYPKNFSSKLAKEYGLFYTQGMPHDTWPLTENLFGEKAFLDMADNILSERRGVLLQELESFKGGVFFFYLDTLDAVQHMFWRYIDTRHPLYKDDPEFKGTIYEYYEKLDGLLGDVLKTAGKDSVVIVVSDHGFNSFRRAVHLNSWLKRNGFLALKDDLSSGKEFFEGIDWQRTKAYSLGFGGIYLNMLGREGKGIVGAEEAGGIKEKIKKGLLEWRDPVSGEPVVLKVYFKEEIFPQANIDEVPDIFVGFNSGFRASWNTALGGVPQSLLEDNNKKWSGDHLMDPQLVPGVFFSNKKFIKEDHGITDIAPTILSLFGIRTETLTESMPFVLKAED